MATHKALSLDTVQKDESRSTAAPTAGLSNSSGSHQRHYPLHSVPLIHAHFNPDNETSDFLRNRSSIQKRTPADDLLILSKNISMVLEELLMRYENSHLPTHGQGWYRMCGLYFRGIHGLIK